MSKINYLKGMIIMGLFVLTDGNQYLKITKKNGSTYRTTTKNINEASTFTRKEASSVLKMGLGWLGNYRIENIEQVKFRLKNPPSKKEGIYIGERKPDVDTEVFAKLDNIISYIKSYPSELQHINENKNDLCLMLSYYDSALSDIHHIIRENNFDDVNKDVLKEIIDTLHDLETKRKKIKFYIQYIVAIDNYLSDQNQTFEQLSNKINGYENCPYKGRTEYFDKISALLQNNNDKKCKPVPPFRGKAVLMLDENTCEQLNAFKSIRQAALYSKLSAKTISKCCKNTESNNIAGGYRWVFADSLKG